MYLMYVDESGDTGLARSPTTHFVLSSLVLHETRWRDFITQVMAFRKWVRANYGLVAANIRSPHTRRAYARAAEEFLGSCAGIGVPSIGAMSQHTRRAARFSTVSVRAAERIDRPLDFGQGRVPQLRNQKFADSPLEEGVPSELVSGTPISM
jgi:hypothetical protein